MTKVRSSDASMIDDRRGSGGGGGGLGGLGSGGFPFPMKAGGGLLGLVVLLAALLLPKLLGAGPSTPACRSRRRGRPKPSTARAAAISNRSSAGQPTTCRRTGRPTCRASSAVTTRSPRPCSSPMGPTTGCGQASSQTGPFYCPVDHLVYIDLGFMQALEQQLIGKPTDLAEQYIVAHEYGHHIQNLLGTNDQVQQAQQQRPEPGQPVLGGAGAAGRLLRRGVGRRCRVARPARLARRDQRGARCRRRRRRRPHPAEDAGSDRPGGAGRTVPPSSARRGSRVATTPATRASATRSASCCDRRRLGRRRA